MPKPRSIGRPMKRLSTTDSRPANLGSWGTERTPSAWALDRIVAGGLDVMSVDRDICPLVACTAPEIMLINTDLPAPLRPMMPWISPRRTVRSTSDNGSQTRKLLGQAGEPVRSHPACGPAGSHFHGCAFVKFGQGRLWRPGAAGRAAPVIVNARSVTGRFHLVGPVARIVGRDVLGNLNRSASCTRRLRTGRKE